MRRAIYGVIGLLSLPWAAEATTMSLSRVVNCGTRTPAECSNVIVNALGQGPTFKLKADTPTDAVHGATTINFCNPITLGADILLFKNGVKAVATVDNVGPWLAEQGHRVVSVNGVTVSCDTQVRVEVYDQDEGPSPGHQSNRRRPAIIPSAATCQSRLDSATFP